MQLKSKKLILFVHKTNNFKFNCTHIYKKKTLALLVNNISNFLEFIEFITHFSIKCPVLSDYI